MGLSETQWSEDALLTERIQTLPRDRLDDGSEDDEVEVAVHRCSPGLVRERRANDPIDDPRAAFGRANEPLAGLALATEQQLVEGPPGAQTRRVGEQLADGHRLLAALRERRQHLRDRCVEL